ncbi:riboflavin transporter 2-like isoform X2 [Lepidochelys kempii]|uniref:riboflavin transporter 2-like isoform X2 n=1 Tax=Lepidochelys kempii TaxID=8472 RepID=UPI003C6ED8E0
MLRRQSSQERLRQQGGAPSLPLPAQSSQRAGGQASSARPSVPAEAMALVVHILACLLGTGSWVAINGMWVELPLLVPQVPEGWYLPSYLTVLIQFANVGPLFVTLMHHLQPGQLSEAGILYTIISLGALACVLLAFFWQETSVVGGAAHSTALLILLFFLSLVDCTSSVTFLPFMLRFRARYLTTYFVGEGLSGLVPGLVALAQGVGVARCVNGSLAGNASGTGLRTEYQPARFSIRFFFLFLGGMMGLCLAAFVLLNHLPAARQERAKERFRAQARVEAGSGLQAVVEEQPTVSPSESCWLNSYFGTGRCLLTLGLLSAAGSGFGCYLMAMAVLSPCPPLLHSHAGVVLVVLCWVLFVGSLSYVKLMIGVILRDEGHSALVWCGAVVQLGSMLGALTMFPLVSVYSLFHSGDPCNTRCPS